MDFESFARSELRGLLRLAQSISGDRHLAEDLVQDVLIKTHERWSVISKLDRPDAYVRRMLVNELISWRRKWGRLIPHAEPTSVRQVDNRAHESALADRDALVREIAKLPTRQRVALALRYLADLPDAEIAATLGCRETTVRVHISRALRALRISDLRDATLDLARGDLP